MNHLNPHTIKHLENDTTFNIQCILHTLCNLNCKFCFETKEKGIREYTKINIDYIRNLPNEIIKVIKPIMLENKMTALDVDVMGGELFSDNIPDSIFDVYKEFLYDIKNLCDVKLIYFIFSNAIFTNHNRVLELLDPFNVNLVLSYDPIDRFNNNKQKEIWLDTFNYFRDKNVGLSLSTVLTKKSINAYIKGDEIFNKIDNSIQVDTFEYFPRLDYHDYLPNDDDLYNFYKWCIDNDKYNITHIQDILTGNSCCTAGSSYVFSESNGVKKYIKECIREDPFTKDDYYGKYSNQIEDVNNVRNESIHNVGLQKRGCLYCEYYSYCPKMCWTQILFKEYKITQCPIKRIYQYIDKDNTIIDRFNIWRDKNDKNWTTI